MIRVEERFMIKELHRQGVSISEIARRTGHDRKTVRAIVNGPLVPVATKRRPKARKLDPFVPYLEKRIAEGVLNAQKLYQELLPLGYEGKERMVRAFVQPYRQPPSAAATVRFETEPGEQAQVDWGHFGRIDYYGRQRPLYGFVMTLGWSRAMYLEFTVSADAAWFLRCHLHAFHYLGGVPQEVLHDNLKTAVLERDGAGHIHWNQRYLDFAHYYGFTPRACWPRRPQTKGKVESGIKYVRGNFWPGLHFADLEDLNGQALGWLNNVANVRVHGTTNEVPFDRLPQEGLMSLAGKADYDTSVHSYRRSSADCLVSYQGNFYSVPAAYVRQQLLVKETEREELLIYTADGEEIAHHRLHRGHRQRVVVPAHYHGIFPDPRRPLAAKATKTQAPRPEVNLFDTPAVETRPLDYYEQVLEMAR